MGTNKPIFRDISGDDPEPETTVIESLCINCQENGTTRLFLTKIPFYKEIVLMSFTCEHCGYQNNEVQSGATISGKGVRITLNVISQRDLNRQVVKSDHTSVQIPEVELEVPAKSQKGGLTTVEGIIVRSREALEQDQLIRRIQCPEAALKIDQFIEKLKKLGEIEQPFTVILEDISGNSFIENPNAPETDANCTTQYFVRTVEQDHELGVFTKNEITGQEEQKEKAILHSVAEEEFSLEDLENEVLQFSTNCPNCGTPCPTNMKLTNIPHFKDVLIMATSCDACGQKSNEVKSSGGFESKGVRIEVEIKNKDDFSRDLLKSETCSLKIPELNLEVGPFALSGRFTTVEGLLVAMKEQLNDPRHTHMFDDSQDSETKTRIEKFIQKFDEILEGNLKVTLILDDPAGNSYIQSMRDDDECDEGLRIIHYERSFDQNEELGLNDMKTENYEESSSSSSRVGRLVPGK